MRGWGSASKAGIHRHNCHTFGVQGGEVRERLGREQHHVLPGCVESMASMLFAMEAMITKLIPWLTTRTREGDGRTGAYRKPKQKRLIEGHWHLMLRESFVWLLEHVHGRAIRVRLVFEHNLGGQVNRPMRSFDFSSSVPEAERS